MMICLSQRVKNIVKKGENAGYHDVFKSLSFQAIKNKDHVVTNIFSFLTMFSKAFLLRVDKSQDYEVTSIFSFSQNVSNSLPFQGC